MFNKILLSGIGLLLPILATAQDIYQMENFSSGQLNGTARYVGMGGAMSALGADLSTMSTNPAAIGLYRRSDIAMSLGVVTQEDAEKFDGKNKTHLSFDQLGFVYAFKLDDSTCKFLNFGFNYHKQKDFNRLISASGSPAGNASQTWQMADLASYWGGHDKATPLANMGWEAYLIGADDDGNYNAYGASALAYKHARWGSIQAYDFNISTNLSEQFYLGLTIGAMNVNYHSYSLYAENLVNSDGQAAGTYSLSDDRTITGSAFNVKLGFIARPVKESPFRVGVSVSTPTYYNLRQRSFSRILANYSDDNTTYDPYADIGGYDYNIHTPWTFNLSLGHTIANCVAIGAEYEYADYSTAKVTYDSGYDDWGWGSDETEDRELNNQSSRFLKGVSTFKLGLEWMVDPKVAIRFGYNYVSSPFKTGAYPNQTINSASIDYQTTSDYMNLSGINRYTVGLGFNFGKAYLDAACQYAHQSGTFYPFNTQNGIDTNLNEAPSFKLNLSNTQLMVTVGYRF